MELVNDSYCFACGNEIMNWRIAKTEGDAVTGQLNVRLRRPLPVGTAVQARGRIVSRRGRLVTTQAMLVGEDNTLYATADGKFMLQKPALAG